MLIRNITLLITLQLSLSTFGQESCAKYLNAEEFRIGYDSEVYAIMVDVRLKMEYRRGHIEDAINVPAMKNMVIFSDSLDLETPLYLYCSTDTRSKTAAEYLIGKGFMNVYLLEEGFFGWRRKGLEVVKKKGVRRRA